jgi:hypothetical protein
MWLLFFSDCFLCFDHDGKYPHVFKNKLTNISVLTLLFYLFCDFRPMDEHTSRPSSRGGDDNHMHPYMHRGIGTGTGTGTREFLRSISNPPPRSSDRGARQLESQIGMAQESDSEGESESEKNRPRERPRLGINRIEDCKTKLSDILAVTGQKESNIMTGNGSIKNGDVVTYCDTNSSSRTHTRADISTDRCTNSYLRVRLSVEGSHTDSSNSNSNSNRSMDIESPYTKAVNRFLDRNSRTSPMETILHGEDSRKIFSQDSLPAMENVPLKTFSRKIRDEIIVSVIRSLDVGHNTELNRVNSTDNIDNQVTNSKKQNNNLNIDRSLLVEQDFFNSEKSLRSISEKIKRNINENFEKHNSYRRK